MNLHDATLVRLTVDWGRGDVTVLVRPVRWSLDAPEEVEVVCLGVSHVEVPRAQPWGRSVSINEISAVDGRLVIGMQSGDEIVIEASSVTLP